MKIKIQETGRIIDISVRGSRSEADCLPDILAQCGEDYPWDDSEQCYVMPEDSADFWSMYARERDAIDEALSRIQDRFDGLSPERQLEVLYGFSGDPEEYVYQDREEDTEEELRLAWLRVEELRTAVHYASKEPDIYVIHGKPGWEHPRSAGTIAEGPFRGWIVVPIIDAWDWALEQDEGVIEYLEGRSIQRHDARETDYLLLPDRDLAVRL